MSDIIIPILSVVAITDIILGLIVVSRGIKSFADIIFGCITLTLIVWSIAIIGFYSGNYQTIINWVSVTHSSALLISFFFLIFSLYFPQKLSESRIVAVISSIILVALLYLISFSHLVIGDTYSLSYKLGTAYIYYASVLMLFFLFGFGFLLKQFKKAANVVQRKQIEYVLAGYLISSVLAIIPDLILPYFNIFQYTWLGPIFALILVTSLFIAVFKYQLFQVKIILTEIINILIIVALLLELFFVQSTTELFLKTATLVVVTIFSYVLIRGVYKEVAQREKIELLATDLQKANDRLRELDKQKTEFISFATHQLRAPITAIKGYASLALEGDLGPVSAKVHDATERVFESSKTMANVIDDYLNVSRIELGSMKYDFVPLDMKVMVSEVVAELKPVLEKTGLKFEWKAIGEGPWKVSADPDKLKQVITNIIDNSVKYTPSGSLTVALERVPNADGTIPVRFTVTDTGIGIAPEVMPKLFQKFSRAGNANKQNIHGTGLGLFIAKDIVTAHKGRIWAESAGEGKGSKFFVELPVI